MAVMAFLLFSGRAKPAPLLETVLFARYNIVAVSDSRNLI